MTAGIDIDEDSMDRSLVTALVAREGGPACFKPWAGGPRNGGFTFDWVSTRCT